LLVFSSQATSDGIVGGPPGMDQICLSEDPSSHLFRVDEIENALSNNGVIFRSPFHSS
jgi:hypothetical protein